MRWIFKGVFAAIRGDKNRIILSDNTVITK